MIKIFCDGGCHGNGQEDNIGGSGYVVVGEDDELLYFNTEVEKNTTNNRQELISVINALKWAKSKELESVSIYSDSQYVVKGLTSWSRKWKTNGWKKTKNSKSFVKNADLWKELDQISEEVVHTLEWIKGHQNKGNWNDFIDNKIQEDIKLG